MFDLMNICGEVVIGEGIKDNAPGIFKGEQLGTWLPGTPQFDIAIDPIDGTTTSPRARPTRSVASRRRVRRKESKSRSAIFHHFT
jgi:fructose-1,6-bisphosphatase/sedoheptulose 1,7-bisphosphatase-like protein